MSTRLRLKSVTLGTDEMQNASFQPKVERKE